MRHRSLKSVYLTEDADLAQHYGDVLGLLPDHPEYADEAKKDLLDKVQPAHRSAAEQIAADMKKYARLGKGPGREKAGADIVQRLGALPVREGVSRRLGRLSEAVRQSFSLGFRGDVAGHGGPTLTGFSSVEDQRWPMVEAEDISMLSGETTSVQDVVEKGNQLVIDLEELIDAAHEMGELDARLPAALKQASYLSELLNVMVSGHRWSQRTRPM